MELAWLDALQPAAPPVAAPVVSAPAAVPAAVPPIRVSSSAPVASETRAAEFAPVGDASPATAGQTLPRPAQPVPDSEVVEVLRANWTTLLQVAESLRGPQLRGALRTLRNVVASGDDIYLAFERDFAKNVVEKTANRQTVEDLIDQLLGRRVTVHCQVGAQVTGVPQQRSTPAPVARPPAEPPHETDLEQDPVALHAQQTLGAVASKLPAGKKE